MIIQFNGRKIEVENKEDQQKIWSIATNVFPDPKPQRDGKGWRKVESDRLLEMFNQGWQEADMAEDLGRSIGGVNKQLNKLLKARTDGSTLDL